MNSSSQPIHQAKRRWTPFIGYVFAAAALLWVFHGIRPSVLRQEYAAVNWPLALAGMIFDIGRYVSQSIRWKLLLSSFCTISVFKTFRALYAGVFINMLFPLRIGEVARAFIVSRSTCSRFSSALSSLFVEYLFDGIWLGLGIGLSALCLPLPPQIAGAARIFGIAVVIAVAGFCYIVARDIPVLEHQLASSHGLVRATLIRLTGLLHKIRAGIHAMSRSRFFAASFFLSGANLFFHMGAFWIIMKAYGIHLPFFIAAAVMLFVFVGLIIPNAPSNVGSFQFFCVIALMAVGIDKTQAAGFSLLVFVLVSIPQITIGFIAFAGSGKTFSEIKNEIARLRRTE
ncbi:MAG TPA: lysylphosphatidylglycerol synthase transmembrane domain-containing protein [Chitinivibrionales bacterium]